MTNSSDGYRGPTLLAQKFKLYDDEWWFEGQSSQYCPRVYLYLSASSYTRLLKSPKRMAYEGRGWSADPALF
jgi:hypothetical protein